MKYAMMIYETPEELAKRADHPETPAYWEGWIAFAKAIGESGVMVGGEGLMPPATATTVRMDGDARVVEDGPFADVKEQLGGFFLLDVPDLDAALEWAAKAPNHPHGSVEVRPLMSPPEN